MVPAPPALRGAGSFYRMQFVDGQLLRDRIAGMAQKQAIDIGIQVAEGLAAAHEKGSFTVISSREHHGAERRIVQIMDFGLAKLKGVSRLTRKAALSVQRGICRPSSAGDRSGSSFGYILTRGSVV